MGPDDIIRSPHAKAPLRAWPAAPPSQLLDIKTNVQHIPYLSYLSYPPHHSAADSAKKKNAVFSGHAAGDAVDSDSRSLSVAQTGAHLAAGEGPQQEGCAFTRPPA